MAELKLGPWGGRQMGVARDVREEEREADSGQGCVTG